MLKTKEQLEREWMGEPMTARRVRETRNLVRDYRRTQKVSIDIGFVIRTVLPIWLAIYGVTFVGSAVLGGVA